MDNELKYKLVEKIIQSNDAILLNEIKTLMGLADEDFWLEVPTEVKNAINKAKMELDNGEGTQHDQVMAEVSNRFLTT
jgi:hypothetical protein